MLFHLFPFVPKLYVYTVQERLIDIVGFLAFVVGIWLLRKRFAPLWNSLDETQRKRTRLPVLLTAPALVLFLSGPGPGTPMPSDQTSTCFHIADKPEVCRPTSPAELLTVVNPNLPPEVSSICFRAPGMADRCFSPARS